MLRGIYNLLTLAALLISILVAILWLRSFTVQDIIFHGDGWIRYLRENARNYTCLESSLGRIHFFHGTEISKPRPPIKISETVWVTTTPSSSLVYREHLAHLFDDIGIGENALSGSSQGFEVMFPYWILLVGLAMLPIARITHSVLSQLRTARHQRQQYLCKTCGYDLRATPHRCPECGTVYPEKNAECPKLHRS